MNDLFHHGPNERAEELEAAARASAQRERLWLRRMLILLVACCTAFALTALWFSHLSASLSIEEANTQATRVVREHFAALERGDLRTAYGQFSARYRKRMSFALFEQMIAGHWRILSGQVTVLPQSATPNRVVLHVGFEESSGTSLSAEFTLVRSHGRWWIDNVLWGAERVQHLIRA